MKKPEMPRNTIIQLGLLSSASWFMWATPKYRIVQKGELFYVQCKYKFIPIWFSATMNVFSDKRDAYVFISRSKRARPNKTEKKVIYEE